MPHQHLLVKRDDAITTITLNRPEKRNALALDVMVELTGALREVGDSDALGVILAANGPVFSAGHNFGDMRGADLSEARRLFQICTAMMDAVQEIPQPVVAKVHALATTGGGISWTASIMAMHTWNSRRAADRSAPSRSPKL